MVRLSEQSSGTIPTRRLGMVYICNVAPTTDIGLRAHLMIIRERQDFGFASKKKLSCELHEEC